MSFYQIHPVPVTCMTATSSDYVSWLSCSIERVSVNTDVLAPNLKEVSLTALCLIHDTISEGHIEIGAYTITDELLTSCIVHQRLSYAFC